jgi:hypothetical protein
MAKKKHGRPTFEPTDKQRSQVKAMALAQIDQETIARSIEVSKPTLLKYFRSELDDSNAQADSSVVGALYKSAITGNVAAQIFWCKARLGWSERQVVQVEMPPQNIQFITRDTDPAPFPEFDSASYDESEVH